MGVHFGLFLRQVIVIDDARLFRGMDDCPNQCYPTVLQVAKKVWGLWGLCSLARGVWQNSGRMSAECKCCSFFVCALDGNVSCSCFVPLVSRKLLCL